MALVSCATIPLRDFVIDYYKPFAPTKPIIL